MDAAAESADGSPAGGSAGCSPAGSPVRLGPAGSPPALAPAADSPPASQFQSPPRSLPYPFFGKPGGMLAAGGLLPEYGGLGPPPPPPPPPERPAYSSPPPLPTTDPSANECKLVDYRTQKVAAFIINGETMLCLPQAFELFLKHLVGGLHTVYTKLKRLDIVPVVCNVEQVRILRGLGAIQPGVNRCKLLSMKEFDVLYRDCTTARPGRPPKRAPGFAMTPSPDALLKLKQARMENGADYFENGHMRDHGIDKSPLLSNGYSHPPHLNPLHYMALGHPAAAAQAAQAAALFGPAGLPSLPAGHGLTRPDQPQLVKHQAMPHDLINRSAVWENCRAAYEDVVKHLERLKDHRGDVDRPVPGFDGRPRDLSINSGSPGHSPVLNLSKSADGTNSDGQASNRDDDDDDDDERLSEANDADDKEPEELSEGEGVGGDGCRSEERSGSVPPPAAAVGWPGQLSAAAADPAVSSTETLLRNIQGLLKVAADNARQQERQINYEKAELKMGVLREKETRENMEKKLQEEQKLRMMYQRRLKKERRFRRKLQEQLGLEARRRSQFEETLRAAPADTFHGIPDKAKETGVRPPTQPLGPPPASSPLSDPRGVFYGASPMFSSAT